MVATVEGVGGLGGVGITLVLLEVHVGSVYTEGVVLLSRALCGQLLRCFKVTTPQPGYNTSSGNYGD